MKKSLDCFFGFVLVVFLMMTVLSPLKAEAAPGISIISPNIAANWVSAVDGIDGDGNPFFDIVLSLDGPNKTLFNFLTGTGWWALPANNVRSPNIPIQYLEYWSFGPNTQDPVFAISLGGYTKVTLMEEVSAFAGGNVYKYKPSAGGPETTLFTGPQSPGSTAIISQEEVINLLGVTPTKKVYSTDSYQNSPLDLGYQHFILARDIRDTNTVIAAFEDSPKAHYSDGDNQDGILKFQYVPESSTNVSFLFMGVAGLISFRKHQKTKVLQI